MVGGTGCLAGEGIGGRLGILMLSQPGRGGLIERHVELLSSLFLPPGIQQRTEGRFLFMKISDELGDGVGIEGAAEAISEILCYSSDENDVHQYHF